MTKLNTLFNHMFWIGYGSNYIVSSQYENETFCKTEIKYMDGSQYKFSKYNMFTFNGDKSLYMIGAIK